MSEKMGAVPVWIRPSNSPVSKLNLTVDEVLRESESCNGLALTHSQLRQLCEKVADLAWSAAFECHVKNQGDWRSFLASPEFQKALELNL